MRFVVGLLWIISLSSRINPLAHAIPLEFHHLPYRWHYPTPIVVAPSAVDYTALVVDHDAPSGREAEVKDKDKYGEDYILEEIVFSHGDIGSIGKLDYYIDEGIEYYDMDIFAASYSGEKTPPKPSRKFGSNDDRGRTVDNVEVAILDGQRFKDLALSGHSNQDGRRFNTPLQNTDGYIYDSTVKDFERYSGGMKKQDGTHFSVQVGRPDYQSVDGLTSNSRIEGLNGYYEPNSQGHILDVDLHIGSPEHETHYQAVERPATDSRLHGQNTQNELNFNRRYCGPEYQTDYQRTENPITDSRILGRNNQDRLNVNQHVPEYQTDSQRAEVPITDSQIVGEKNQEYINFNHHEGSPHPHFKPSIMTASIPPVNGSHFIYKSNRHGQELQGELKARIQNKDEIMEAVE